MNRHWYLSRAGQVFGPVTDAQLAASVAHGQVIPNDLLNEAGQPHWVRAGDVPGLFLTPLPKAHVVNAPDAGGVTVAKVTAPREARVTCFGCFREVSIEVVPGNNTVPCPKCRTAIETGETTEAPPAHQAAFAQLESPAAFKERMQQKVAAAEAAAARDGAILRGVLGGIVRQ